MKKVDREEQKALLQESTCNLGPDKPGSGKPKSRKRPRLKI
jgi:hypothetical protein